MVFDAVIEPDFTAVIAVLLETFSGCLSCDG
jgi:hypothetical protein